MCIHCDHTRRNLGTEEISFGARDTQWCARTGDEHRPEATQQALTLDHGTQDVRKARAMRRRLGDGAGIALEPIEAGTPIR